MKKLLYTTTAFVLCGGIVQANAACIATPSCTAMGYSSTSSCEGGLKCPFGSYWYCPSNSGGECADFPYTCFGRGYLDGVGIGSDCNGKYVKCECYEGFEWQDGKGCVDITDCRIGSILFSDMSCSMSMYDADIGLKTAIGVVVYSDGMGHGQAMALNSLGKFSWGGLNTDIPSLTNYTSASAASKDYDSCGNTEKIMAAGSKSKYPAAWAAHEYSTEGTSAGDWCLPATGIIYNSNKDTVNIGFDRAGGTQWTSDTVAWTSTEYNNKDSWFFTTGILNHSSNYGGDIGYDKNANLHVRPVLAFPVEEKPACDSSYQYTCTGANESPSGEACDGKYTACTCSSGYEWDGSSCIQSCSSSYQYRCLGTYQSPSGSSCGGLYTTCECEGAYSFSNGSCVCKAKYTCTGTGYSGGSGSSCNGKYHSCKCATGYAWCNGQCKLGSICGGLE